MLAAMVLEAAVMSLSHMYSFVIGGLNVEGEADSWDFGVGKYMESNY